MKRLLIILLLITFSSSWYVNSKEPYLKVKNDALTLSNVWDYINNQIPDNQHIIFQQVILETGWLTSNICNTHNNLFGLLNVKNGYYKFDNWKESVLFYKARIYNKYKGGDYYKFLHSFGYAEDKNYVKKLKKIDLNKVFENF